MAPDIATDLFLLTWALLASLAAAAAWWRLAARTARRRKVEGALPAVLYEVGPVGDGPPRIRYLSPSAREVLGVDPEAIHRDPDLLTRLVHADDRASLEEADRRAGPTGPWSWRGRMVRPDGTTVEVECRSTPLPGDPDVRVGILIDVSEGTRSAREAARREGLEELGRVAAQVGHDVNNPLAWLLLNLERARGHRAVLPAEVAEALDEAWAGALRVREAMQALRHRAGQLVPRPPPAPLLDFSLEPRDDARAILVVDDEPTLARSLRRLLRRHAVRIAGSADEALRALEDERPDHVLCDVFMPGETGLDLFRKATARWPRLAEGWVFMSGGDLDPEVTAAIVATGRPILLKPFEPRELAAALFGPTDLPEDALAEGPPTPT